MIQDNDDIFEKVAPQHWWLFWKPSDFLVSGSNPAVGDKIFLWWFCYFNMKCTFFVWKYNTFAKWNVFIIVYCPGISVSNLKNSLLLISLITSKYSSNRSCLEFCGKIENNNLRNNKKNFFAWFKIRTLDLPVKKSDGFQKSHRCWGATFSKMSS